MYRETLPIETLPAWVKLNNVEFNGVKVSALTESRGSGLVVITTDTAGPDAILVKIPQDLILSLDSVWSYATSDRHLREVLEAVGDYSRTARGAILIFLLLQITNSITHIPGTLGVSTPLTDYVKFLPSHVPLPTFWSDPERSSLAGTSIEAALNAKLNSLDREFTFLRNATLSIEWCKHYWWDTETGSLSFEDWKQIDAIYRSRALDLPGTGHAMVPCVDMANHASGEDTVAVYETDVQGDAVLLLRDGKHLSVGDEITITYGDEKGACEMLFSYGFIAETMTSAQELFLDLVIPDDDPLKLAKNSVSKSAPGFRLFLRDGSVDWEGPFVWLLCVNEEDGLDFRLLQQTNGERELKVFWKDIEITDMSKICVLLKEERLWDLFDLRATATIQARVEMQLLALENSKFHLNNISDGGTCAQLQAIRLRDLEETLMLQAYQEFDEKKLRLIASKVVQEYLASEAAADPTAHGEDFS